MSLKSGHTFEEVKKDENKKLYENFGGYHRGVIRLLPQKWLVAKPFLEFADKYQDFKIRPKDVIVMSFLKCGSTWMQEIVWNLLHNPNLDNDKVNVPLFQRSPVIEGDYWGKCLPEDVDIEQIAMMEKFRKEYPDINANEDLTLQMCDKAEDPRVFKTHLPFELLPPSALDNCRFVYTCREPKDVIVSFFKFSQTMKVFDYRGDLDSFIDYFLNDNILMTPYWLHVKQAWDLRNHPNFLFVHFEDVKLNTKAEVTRITNFLGLDLSDKQINNVIKYTGFEEMKKRNPVSDIEDETMTNKEAIAKEGGFFNKGKVGTWRERLTEEQVKKIDEWNFENLKIFENEFKYKKEIQC